MPLANAADRGVAAHLAERFDAVRQQQRLRASARSRQRSLAAGVAAADDNDIEALGVDHFGMMELVLLAKPVPQRRMHSTEARVARPVRHINRSTTLPRF